MLMKNYVGKFVRVIERVFYCVAIILQVFQKKNKKLNYFMRWCANDKNNGQRRR